MALGIRKTVFGLAASLAVLGALVISAFWLLAWIIDRLLGWGSVLTSPFSQILGAASLLIGTFWVTWAYSYLVFVGKGLPIELFGYALEPTKILVTTGPYAYVRHPAMVGMLFLGLGVALLADSPAGMLLVPVAAVIIAGYLWTFEEKSLQRRFGSDYDEYRSNVPMLIPRLAPYRRQSQLPA